MARTKRKPQYVVEDGKPKAVFLDIKQYEQMLERLEEADDLAVLNAAWQHLGRYSKSGLWGRISMISSASGFSVVSCSYALNQSVYRSIWRRVE